MVFIPELSSGTWLGHFQRFDKPVKMSEPYVGQSLRTARGTDEAAAENPQSVNSSMKINVS